MPRKPIEPPYYVMRGGPLDAMPLKMGDPETLPEQFGLEKCSDGIYRRCVNGTQIAYQWEPA